MVDITVVTGTLERLCIVKIPMSFVSLYTTPQIHPATLALQEIKPQIYIKNLLHRKRKVWNEQLLDSKIWYNRLQLFMQIRTCSIFIIIAEVKINGSAELQNIAPLVLVDDLVFRLLIKKRGAVTEIGND